MVDPAGRSAPAGGMVVAGGGAWWWWWWPVAVVVVVAVVLCFFHPPPLLRPPAATLCRSRARPEPSSSPPPPCYASPPPTTAMLPRRRHGAHASLQCFCVVARDDAFLPINSPVTQNGCFGCMLRWSVILRRKTLCVTYFAFGSRFAYAVGDSLIDKQPAVLRLGAPFNLISLR